MNDEAMSDEIIIALHILNPHQALTQNKNMQTRSRKQMRR